MNEILHFSPNDMPRQKPPHPVHFPKLSRQRQPQETIPTDAVALSDEGISGLTGDKLTKALHQALNGQQWKIPKIGRKPRRGRNYTGKLIDMSAPTDE